MTRRRENHLFGVWNTEAGDGVKIISDGSEISVSKARKLSLRAWILLIARLSPDALPDGGWQMFVVPLDEVKTSR